MPRYFFDLADGSRESDDEGTELADSSQARVAAIRFLGEVLTHEPHRLEDGTLRVHVRSSAGEPKLTIATIIERNAA